MKKRDVGFAKRGTSQVWGWLTTLMLLLKWKRSVLPLSVIVLDLIPRPDNLLVEDSSANNEQLHNWKESETLPRLFY